MYPNYRQQQSGPSASHRPHTVQNPAEWAAAAAAQQRYYAPYPADRWMTVCRISIEKHKQDLTSAR